MRDGSRGTNAASPMRDGRTTIARPPTSHRPLHPTKYRRGRNPRPITNTPSHRAVSHQSAEYFSLGQLNNSTRRRTAVAGRRGRRLLMYLPLYRTGPASGDRASREGGGFQRPTGKSSDERLTRFSRYSSAIKLPSTIPPAIKLVRGDTKPNERLPTRAKGIIQ